MATDSANIPGNTAWPVAPSFRRMLARHNRYREEFTRWRRVFRRQAAALAALIKSFPGSEGLCEDQLRGIFTRPETAYAGIPGEKIFAPWTNRWSGVWSNGTPQYHIWETSINIDGQWVQPVSISETGFAELNIAETMLRDKGADIAINVFSPAEGITGWVSKYQHGRAELPHIGYRINDTTLVWICQVKQPDRLFETANHWFIFLETVDQSADPVAYRIYGRELTLNRADAGIGITPAAHCGTYDAAIAHSR